MSLNFLTVSFLVLGSFGAAQASEESKAKASKAVKAAEELRSADHAEIRVDLTNKDNQSPTAYDLKILRVPGRKALVEFLGPKEEIGRRMLAVGNSYWSTFPDSKRVHAISRREAIGNSAFAMADLFQMDVDQDYNSDILRTEKIADRTCLVLELKAKHDEAPYNRILYYVEEATSFPVRAKFYGVSGKHLKTMYVDGRAELMSRIRPKTLRMVDAVIKGKSSVWVTQTMAPKTIPDRVFTVEYLNAQ